MFIDLLIFLNSIRSFPDASEALENQVNADVGEVCYLCLFYDALKYLVYFEITHMRWSALRKLIFVSFSS